VDDGEEEANGGMTVVPEADETGYEMRLEVAEEGTTVVGDGAG
jgi:hypothetical protein